MHFCLSIFAPEGSNEAKSYADALLPLLFGLSRLGFQTETRINNCMPHAKNILFGSPFVSLEAVPQASIFYNTHPLFMPRYQQCAADDLSILRQCTLWDSTLYNLEFLRHEYNLDAAYVPIGYVPEMTRLKETFRKDIDVLFYGTLSERRSALLKELDTSGIRLGMLTDGFGVERDYAIARSKMILNIHRDENHPLETLRLGYLWANRCTVVSEEQPEKGRNTEYNESCAYAPYDELVKLVRDLLADSTARVQQAETGFNNFSRVSQEQYLAPLLGRKVYAGGIQTLPEHLNAGSGSDFRFGSLNVDINPQRNPDLALDLSLPLDAKQVHQTKRFGGIVLKPGSFTRISAFEMLEHVHDLPQLMNNFLKLLRTGGELELSVPYELSLGAVQDPTHVRMFNEMSWIYYTDWAWYMGWREHRFTVHELNFSLSISGKELAEKGMTIDDIVHIPRAVSGMYVRMEKRHSTEEEKREFDLKTRNFYEGAVGEWTI